MYCKENWQSMVEKEPAFGYVDLFQTSPSQDFARHSEYGAGAHIMRLPFTISARQNCPI